MRTLLVALVLAGCPSVVRADNASCTLVPRPLRHERARRVVAIGDLHGDLVAARAALRASGAIDGADHWTGGDLTVVQTGDVLDRGDDESKILSLLERLDGEARQHGGAVIALLGNHELMNAVHDFRYVTPGGARDFDGERAQALSPGGAWARRLARHDVVTIVGDTVFSHAGVNLRWAKHLDDLNLHTRCWLAGQEGGVDHPPAVLTSEDSPVWTRQWGGDPVDCTELAAVLKQLGVARMVVAHTVQAAGITSACNGALWRIDVGLSRFYGGPIEVLELSASPKVISGRR
jgi:Calcineurin-like phosphoesterase